MHHGFNYFLFNMAFADLMIAVFNVGTSWTFNLYHDWWYGDICILTSFFGIAPTTVSVFSMMSLSWDRCQAVVWPLRKRPLSRRRSLIAIVVIWMISTATALPFAFAATVNEYYLYNALTKKASIRHACSAPAHPIFDHLLFLIQYALPLFVLSFTFARIAWAFRVTDVASDSNSKGSNHTRAKSKAVKMLALMVITFMFCWLPYHLYHTFELNSLMEFNNPNIGKYIYLGIYWVAMSSSAYNPIIYCFANERFRIGFRFVFRWLPMINCRREDYEYSQLFPEKLRSMAISLKLGVVREKEQKKHNGKTYNSAGFTRPPCDIMPDRRRIRSTCSSRTQLTVENDI
ncbi:7 transmembrane receptor [Oesophagostomum dentatum]|uniref:7 transmembrane receptor n=1 Tax=Oesophagostomum dentatum TaxID=61180 RepID=A0A0B1SZT5_OESDE|nr:7 transmembrane receptor [Oesophagostomum dentatum]